MRFHPWVFFLGLFLFFSSHAQAADPIIHGEEEIESCHSKLVTLDATPTDPGHVEIDLAYSVRGGKFAWQTDMERSLRGTYLTHAWDVETYIGVYKDIDVALFQSFYHLLDKHNNYNEVADEIDPLTGEAMEDVTGGPTHGGGRGDLGVMGRWRFYENKEKKFELAYSPTVYLPTGRRSNLDHLGPGAGYVSFSNSLIYTQEYKRFCWTLNTGYNAPLAGSEKMGNYRGVWNFNAAAGYQLLSWLHPQLEVIYNHSFENPGKGGKLVSVVAGAIIPAGDHLRFDLGVQQDVLGSNADQLTTGIFRVAFAT